MKSIAELTSTFAQPGQVVWIGARSERCGAMVVLDRSEVTLAGLASDRREKPGRRAVTLIQQEHLSAIEALCGDSGPATPERLRRNIVVSGINLLALRNMRFRIGTVVLQGTGICAPCSRMEAEFGPGGYNAVRGHGGITASVQTVGHISFGDYVSPVVDELSVNSQG